MTPLHTVADHLAKQATHTHNQDATQLLLAGAFGRTAYNRYYYACYLDIRSFVAGLNKSWANLKHSDVPKILINSVNKKINQELSKCERVGMITKGDLLSKKSMVHTSLCTMASVMSEAYTVRCNVDYEPEIEIEFEKNTFLIDKTSVSSAKGWLKTIKIEKFKVMKIMKEIGLVE